MLFISQLRNERKTKMNIQRQADKILKQSMSKKALLEYNKKKRCVIDMNTGTRTHKTLKDYNRQREKLDAKRMLESY